MICAGLNEALAALPTPDPWLAPEARHELGLPSLERRIGLSAHDFASALADASAGHRARREARAAGGRLALLAAAGGDDGGLDPLALHRNWARRIDKPARYAPASAGAVAAGRARPTRIAVTDVDRLKADPIRLLREARCSASAPSTRSTPIRVRPGAAARSTRCSKPG
jgi:ATP-dependent helicase/nuclease subunit B